MNEHVMAVYLIAALASKYLALKESTVGERWGKGVAMFGVSVVLGYSIPETINIDSIVILLAVPQIGDLAGLFLGKGIDKFRVWRAFKGVHKNAVYPRPHRT